MTLNWTAAFLHFYLFAIAAVIGLLAGWIFALIPLVVGFALVVATR